MAKMNVPASSEVGLVLAMVGAAHGNGKEENGSDAGTTFHMPHTRAGMTAYKKASAGTTVEVTDETILPVDGFRTTEVDLDQSGFTTKPVKMVAIAYVPGLLQNLLSTRKAITHKGNPLVYYKTKAVLGFPREESLVYNFCPRKRLFPAICVKRSPNQGAALVLAAKSAEAMIIETTGQWMPCADVRWTLTQGAALAVAARARDMIEVHLVLAHQSEEIALKTVETMMIATTGQ